MGFFFFLVVACKLLVAANRIQTLGLNPGPPRKWGVLATRPSPYQIFLNFTDSWARYEFSMAIKGLPLNTHTSKVRGRKHKENWSEFQLQLGYVTSSLFLQSPPLHPSSLPDRDCLTSSHSGITVNPVTNYICTFPDGSVFLFEPWQIKEFLVVLIQYIVTWLSS